MTTQTIVRTTPLFQKHVDLGAHMTEFAGWNMPVYYKSIIEEHLAVRREAGLFDVSHMCPFELRGPGAFATLQYLCTNDAAKLPPGKVQYNLLLNDKGGVVDDVLLYRLAENRFILVANAGNAETVESWLGTHRRGSVEIINLRLNHSILSLQGPAAPQFMGAIGLKEAQTFGPHVAKSNSIEGSDAFVSRTGYTGSDGFEFILPNTIVERVWEKILNASIEKVRVLPCGLGARDSLRTEAGLPLYGHEYAADRIPLGTPFTWAIKFTKEDFLGKQALLEAQQKPMPHVMVAFVSDSKQIPRSGQSVHISDTLSPETACGWVSSGTFSPLLSKAIGMAFVRPPAPSIGNPIFINVRNRAVHAIIAPLPFVGKT